MRTNCIFFSFILYSLTCIVNGSKILVIFAFPSYSHFAIASRLAKELSARDHEVTVISPYPERNPIKNYRDIPVEEHIEYFEVLKRDLFQIDKMGMLGGFTAILDMGVQFTNKTFSNPKVEQLLNSKEEFDVVILECFLVDGLVGVAHHFQAPLIFLSHGSLGGLNNYLFANPAPSSYVPAGATEFSSRMTFWERLSNFFFNLVGRLALEMYYLPKQRQIFKQYTKTNLDLDDVLYNASLLLVNSHVSLGDAVPHVPSIIDVAGLHISHPEKLQPDLQTFLDNAIDGVILFSMGSNLNSKDISEKTRKGILSSFSKINQRVLWKFEEDLPDAPANVKIMKWLPQQSVLAHPNMKAFISHGGLMSTIESVYFGVPIIGIPIYGDQKGNIAKAKDNGYAVSLSLEELSEEKLSWALNEILNDPKYSENVKRRSEIMQNQLVSPIDSAVYWVEHVIRYKGAPHLKSAGLDLKWYQKEMVDIFAFLGLLIIITLIISYITIRNVGKILLGVTRKVISRKLVFKDKSE